MNEKKDERSLDELIIQSINAEKPEFDAERWKNEFPEEFQLLCSHRNEAANSSFNCFGIVVSAVAAVILVAVGFFVSHHYNSRNPVKTKTSAIAESPTQMLTAISLTMAYRRGGMEAVEKQCRRACQLLGPRAKTPTLQELIKELESSQSERAEL